MAKPSILVTRRLPDAVQARIARDYEAEFNDDDHVFSPDELLRRLAGKDAVLPCHSERFTREVIEQVPESVKIIANFSVGVDHVDLDAAKERGIVVTNTPDVLSDATAEIALLLTLGAARRASEGERLVRSGEWKDWSPSFMVGTQVTGKTVGIVGMGRVGQVAARRFRGFDMQVRYHNRSQLPAEQEQGAVYHGDLDEMLGHPAHDPYGNPIPSREGRIADWTETPLSDAAVGCRLVVQRVSDSDHDLLEYLESISLLPGSHVMVLDRSRIDGALTIRVEGCQAVIDFRAASHIFVEKENGGRGIGDAHSTS